MDEVREQRGAGRRGQLAGLGAGAGRRQAAQELDHGGGRHGQLAVGGVDRAATQHRRRGDDPRRRELGGERQHADQVDGGVETRELVQVLALAAVHGAFGRCHALGDGDDAVGDGVVEGRAPHRGDELGEGLEAGPVVDGEARRRQAAAPNGLDVRDGWIDAGRRERRRDDPGERLGGVGRGTARGAGRTRGAARAQREQRRGQHVAAHPARTLEVEQRSV